MPPDIPIESWKNQPYVWMLILIPLSAVVVGVIMLTLAIKSDTGLVVDDYYKKGKQINRVLARDQAASAMGLSSNISFADDDGMVLVKLKANSTLTTNEQIKLGLFHSTKPGIDQTLSLQPVGNQSYTAKIDELDQGRWHVQLETETWRLTGSLHVPGGKTLELSALATN
ncbi:MAG: FixH family protein [Gammaproteobacteria bacterium]|nr:FixH family protein [Gammaproteobacteria bacterium]